MSRKEGREESPECGGGGVSIWADINWQRN